MSKVTPGQITSPSSTPTTCTRPRRTRSVSGRSCDAVMLQNQLLLLQKHWGSGHHGDPPPIPHHNDEDAGREEGLHGKPHLGEASILVDSLERSRHNFEGDYILMLFSTSKCILEGGKGRPCLLNRQDQELSHLQRVLSSDSPWPLLRNHRNRNPKA